MLSVVIRIGLRWLAGALVAHGYLGWESQDIFADPELISMIEMGLGGVAGAAAEAWYYLAKRFGWNT